VTGAIEMRQSRWDPELENMRGCSRSLPQARLPYLQRQQMVGARHQHQLTLKRMSGPRPLMAMPVQLGF